MNNSIQTNKNIFNWVNQTKGLAILAIVIFHFFQNYPERIQLILSLDRNMARLGYAAVDIFFVMAGFNTSYSISYKSIKVQWNSWLIKRLIRLYPGYLLAVVCTCFLYYFGGLFKIKLTLKFLLSILGLAGIQLQVINPGFWFFTVILEIYIFTGFIFWLCQNKPSRILLLGIIGGVLTKILSLFFLIQNDTSNYLFFLQNNFLGSYLFQFCLGLYWGFIYAKYQGFRKIDFVLAINLFSLGFIAYTVLAISHVNIIYMLGFDMLFTPFFFLGIQTLLVRLDNNLKIKPFLNIIGILGIYSYQIYLIHQPLYFVTFHRLNQYIQCNSYLKIIFFLLVLSISLSMYVILFIKLEQLIIKKLTSVLTSLNKV